MTELEKYPKATAVIKQWFLEKMIASLADDSVDEDFKQFMREQGIDTDKLIIILNSNPHAMFEVFDAHKLYISVMMTMMDGVKFQYVIADGEINRIKNVFYDKRFDAERNATIEALGLLEEKL